MNPTSTQAQKTITHPRQWRQSYTSRPLVLQYFFVVDQVVSWIDSVNSIKMHNAQTNKMLLPFTTWAVETEITLYATYITLQQSSVIQAL